jgi:hypothetical protein
MLFPKRQSYVNNFQGTVALGSSINLEITRDFFLDSLMIFIPITVTVTPGDLTAGGLWNVVKNIQLLVADGQSNRQQTNVSGFGALRYAGKVLSGLDRQTLSANTAFIQSLDVSPTAATYLLCYPLLFKHPQISDPIGSAFMLPLPRYNANPVLTIQFGALTDITTGGEDTVTIGNPFVITNKRQVDVITFPTWQTELIENVQAYPNVGANQLYELQVPGSYTCLQIFGQNAAGVAQDLSGGLPFQLQYLGNTLRQFTYPNIKAEENYSQGNDGNFTNTVPVAATPQMGDFWPGLLHLDFLFDGFGMEVGELGSVLNANLLAGSGSRVQLISNLASSGQYSYLWHRIFGDLTPLKLSTQVAAN